MFKLSVTNLQHLRVLSQRYTASSVSCAGNLIQYSGKHCCNHISSRNVTTNSAGQYVKELYNDGKWKLKNAVRKIGVLDFSRNRLSRSGYQLYDEIADHFDYQYFFNKFNMPDTFHSWFLVMELHVWIVLVRLMAEAEEGRLVRNNLIEAMWEDIRQKTGLLGAENTATARAQIKILAEEFQAALVGYDEGILGNDTVLAGAVWRRFFSKDCNDPELVETVVKYIRKHVKHFDLLTKEDVLIKRKFMWFPMEDTKT